MQGVAKILAQGALMLACSCAMAWIGLQQRTSVDAMQQAPSSASLSGGQSQACSHWFGMLSCAGLLMASAVEQLSISDASGHLLTHA